MKLKVLRYKIDTTTNERTMLEEREITSPQKELTARCARELLKETYPDWCNNWEPERGWPYLYKFRDERGKVFKVSKAIAAPFVKGSFHPVREILEIWEGPKKATAKKTKKPRAPRTKKSTVTDDVCIFEPDDLPPASK